MRTKNLAAGANEGDVYLYDCPQNHFLFPSLWSTDQLSTSSGKSSVHITAAKPNDIAVLVAAEELVFGSMVDWSL